VAKSELVNKVFILYFLLKAISPNLDNFYYLRAYFWGWHGFVAWEGEWQA
jgi:hypothetical protein